MPCRDENHFVFRENIVSDLERAIHGSSGEGSGASESQFLSIYRLKKWIGEKGRHVEFHRVRVIGNRGEDFVGDFGKEGRSGERVEECPAGDGDDIRICAVQQYKSVSISDIMGKM